MLLKLVETGRNLRKFAKNKLVIPSCPIHVVTFTLISILATDYIQKRRGQLPFSNLNIICCQIWYQSKSDYMDRALDWKNKKYYND